jgi:hypothetical protein
LIRKAMSHLEKNKACMDIIECDILIRSLLAEALKETTNCPLKTEQRVSEKREFILVSNTK